ncbi:hypothetical protein [Massilia suwonensis]|uniref:Uncharacterized protein n=1 Tax=Massilia suwonensis TaxID=648895 RepID=A0ABW0MTD0_9BURK
MKISLALSMLFSACALGTAAHAVETWTLPGTKAVCLAKGGVWEKRGMPGDPQDREVCVLNAPDAGKQCSSSARCLSGWCRPNAKEGWKPAGEKAPGVCEAVRQVNGCVQGLDKGVIVDIPCVM